MNQLSQFPQISTRGRYNLWTGEELGKKSKYSLYPKKKFNTIEKAKELVIFVHGMRNSSWGAKRGGLTLRQTLRKLGYKKHPIVTFSYDADIRGAHIPSKYKKTLNTAYSIAIQNGGTNLLKYIQDLKKVNPNIKIHLVGHSLGCVVVNVCVECLDMTEPKGFISSVHLLASPVEMSHVKEMIPYTKVVNYYNPTDDVILEGVDKAGLELPSCLIKKIKGAKTVTLLAKDHRFRSYAKELKSFP